MATTVKAKMRRPNFSEFELGDLTIYFSYETPIAFHLPSHGTTVRENDWGPATGKHLNSIDGGTSGAKMLRITGPDFTQQLSDALNRTGDFA